MNEHERVAAMWGLFGAAWLVLASCVVLSGCGAGAQSILCTGLDCALVARHAMCPKHDPSTCPYGHPEDTLETEPGPDDRAQ
jgi:hypothetical protein